MSRRVEAPVQKLAGGKAEGGDDFFGRLIKYIPAEIVGLYLAAKGVPVPDTRREDVLWFIFWACLILTPIYLAFTTRDKDKSLGPLWLQVLLATIAFPIWILALGKEGAFGSWGIEEWISSLILLFVTFIFGLIKPPPEKG